jgi:hypothetical protein
MGRVDIAGRDGVSKKLMNHSPSLVVLSHHCLARKRVFGMDASTLYGPCATGREIGQVSEIRSFWKLVRTVPSEISSNQAMESPDFKNSHKCFKKSRFINGQEAELFAAQSA